MSKDDFIVLYAAKMHEKYLARPDQYRIKPDINNGVADEKYFQEIARNILFGLEKSNISDNLKAAVQEAANLPKLPTNDVVRKFVSTFYLNE